MGFERFWMETVTTIILIPVSILLFTPFLDYAAESTRITTRVHTLRFHAAMDEYFVSYAALVT